MRRSLLLHGIMSVLFMGLLTPIFAQSPSGKGLTVTLDYYYNHEFKKDKAGNTIRWHYIWDEQENGGFSLWANIWDSLGVKRDTLAVAPTKANLRNSNIYIMVDPDTEAETPHPNYMNEHDANEIYNWVKAGGVLILLENDSLNAEFDHFNKLSERFGIHFNGDSRNRVQGKHYEQGAFMIPANHEVFPSVQKIYIKEISSLTLKAPARAVYKDGDIAIMAVAKVGKGAVFAVGDPWFYNEYVDGKRLTPDYQNYQAAIDLSNWAIKQAKAKK